MALEHVKALVFDVFGTVVDWRSSIIREGETLARAKGWPDLDWPRFADQWRKEGYTDAIARIRRGEANWANADALHRAKLDQLIGQYGLTGLTEAEIDELNRAWHRLTPWPDAVPGLTRLKQKFVISPMSNGSFALLTNLGKHAALPWDCILSAELVRAYKPDPETYLSAPTLLGLEPGQVMLVAAHVNDLRAAQTTGLRAGFVPRPLEHGRGGPQEPEADPSFDVVATDFHDLADKLEA